MGHLFVDLVKQCARSLADTGHLFYLVPIKHVQDEHACTLGS